jgi:DNA-binding beta-propeller fold protein YncE
MIRLTTTTKVMAAGLMMSLGWVVLAACDCNEDDYDESFSWVECDGNQPVLMNFIFGEISFFAEPFFNADDWDCSHPASPHYKNSEAAAPSNSGSSGPGGSARQPHAAGSPGGVYLPHHLRVLPFTPSVPPPGTPPMCDSSYPDILQTVHTNALVTRISTCPFQLKTTIPVVTRPLQVVVTPDGSTALVTSFDNAVNFIDLSTNKVTYTLMTDPSVNPNGIAVTSDGSRAYVTSFNPGNPVVLVIDLSSRSVIATISGLSMSYPQGATLTPDGSQLWITSPLDGETDVVDTLTNTLVTRLNIGASTDVAFNSNGTRAYVTTDAVSPGQVVVVDTGTYKILSTYTVGQGPADISMSYGDKFLVVNNDFDGSVSVIDLVKNKVVTKTIGANPSGIVFVH